MVNKLSGFLGIVVILLALLSFAPTVESRTNVPIPQGMVKIPAGNYIPFFKTKGIKTIKVASFCLDKYAVTNADFLRFIKANPKWARSKVSKVFSDAGYLKHWKSDYDLGKQQLSQSPVVNISWFAANAYSKWKGKRLPTLEEWEYAGTAAAINDKRPVEKIILEWYNKPSPDYLPPVGSTFTNKLQVADLHGLVWEWVSDFNSIMMSSDSRSSSTINRDLFCASGSAGAIDKENYAAFMRFAFRSSLKAKYTVNNLGFRCAADITR
jgi:formylglycine-generating enzyme required for sulfatase activity